MSRHIYSLCVLMSNDWYLLIYLITNVLFIFIYTHFYVRITKYSFAKPDMTLETL